jgi:hypothetical protein
MVQLVKAIPIVISIFYKDLLLTPQLPIVISFIASRKFEPLAQVHDWRLVLIFLYHLKEPFIVTCTVITNTNPKALCRDVLFIPRPKEITFGIFSGKKMLPSIDRNLVPDIYRLLPVMTTLFFLIAVMFSSIGLLLSTQS